MLKLITPFRVLFNLDSSKIAAQPKVFAGFLEKVRDAVADPNSALAKKIHPALEVEVNLPKAKPTDSSGARDAGRFFIAPHVLILRFRASYRADMEKLYARAAEEADATVEKFSQMLTPDLDSLFVKLNDNTVAILSLDFAVNAGHIVKGKEGWNRLNE